MTILRILAVLAAGISLTACTVAETPTRNVPIDTAGAPAQRSASQQTIADQIRINRVVVEVPTWLRVSEANRYLPVGDIVWRGEPMGNRWAQVQAIFEEGMGRGARAFKGPRAVDLHVSVRRFHALTEKARYTTGGVHHIVFVMTLVDPRTGELVVPWRTVQADLEAFGGQKAIAADMAGQTQKVRITNHLSKVLVEELSKPSGFKNPELGLIQALNEI